ncbi:hypothetical protein HPB47_010582 [Ixodes persulcatus]|uniref:Uncharacterized protein n=1 Tax=Ixodes persulcatus TaxID=34615 RepID=A0AC60NZ07_IXOPE|nr:hypothetical protein HPB47_010582 [Ixodes persulcatus]
MRVLALAFLAAGVAVALGAPAAEEGPVPETSPRHLGRKPFDLGIDIPRIFNMKLLTGAGGTGLGINIPAILDLRLDRRSQLPGSLLIDLFGGSGRRGPGVIRPPPRDDEDNVVERP